MASALRRQQDREHREPRGIRIRLRLHRDSAEHELRSALKLAERQQNYVRQCRPLENTVTASKGKPFYIRRNDGPLPRARKRTSKVPATGSNLGDAQVVRQDGSFSFTPKDRGQETLLEKPPVAETKKNIEDAIRPAPVVETDLMSSYGKEFVDFIPEQLQTPPNAQLAPKLEGRKIQIKAEKSSQKKRRKADKKKQKEIEAKAKQIRKRLKADYKLASGNSEHFAAWAEAYQKLAERSEDAASVHLKPENNDHRTGRLRWLKGLLHRKSSTKPHEQVDAKEIPDLGPWLKPELEATPIPPHVLEQFYAELPAYSAVEIGDCEGVKEIAGAANLSNDNSLSPEELPFETEDPSMPVNITSPQACTSCGTRISCLPGVIFYECDVCRDDIALSCYDNEVCQCRHGCQELIQEGYSQKNKFPTLPWSPTAQEYDVAESRSWQPPPHIPCPTHSSHTLSFPQSSLPQDQVGATPEPRKSVRDIEHSSAREIPFRDILSLEKPPDRILAFNTSRGVAANQDAGLERWLQAMGNDLPQHSNIFAAEKSRLPEMKQATDQRTQLPAHPNIFEAEKSGMAGMRQGSDQQAQLLKQLEEELASAKLIRAQHERVLAEHREELMALRENLTRREKEVALREQRETLQERDLLSRMAEASKREREASLREREASIRERDASIRERDASARERETSVHEREALFREQALLVRQSEAMPSQQTASLQEATHVSSTQTLKLRCTRTPSQAPRQDIAPLSRQSHRSFRTSSLRPTSRVWSTETAEVGREQSSGVPPRSVNPTEELNYYLRAAEETESGPSPFGNRTGHDLLRIVSQAVGDAVSALFKFKKTSFRTHTGTKRKTSGRAASGKGSSQPRSRHRPRPRLVPLHEDEANDDDEDSDGRLRKRKKPNTVLPHLGERLLACPYSKLDCNRYSERNTREKAYRGCKKCWLSDISRVKQHLYRVHSRPDYYCPRCYEVFESSSLLDGHVRQANSCIVGDCPFPEKFTDAQMKELKRKWPGKTAEECWYIIFGILFPNSLVPANPYAEDNLPEAPTQLMVPNAPRVLSQILRERLSQLEHTPATAPLLSNEAQTLLGRMIEEAMTEMLHRRVLPDASLSQSAPSISVNGEQPLSHYSHGISTEQGPSLSSGFLPEDVHSDPLSGNIAQPSHSVASGHLDRHVELRNRHSNPPIAETHPPGPKSAKIPKLHSTSVDSSSLKSTLSSSATAGTYQNDALSDHFGPHQRPDEPSTANSVLYHPDQLHSLPATTGNRNPFYANMQITQATYNHLRNATFTSSDINTSSGTSSTESLFLQTPSLIDLNNGVDCMPPMPSQETGHQFSPDEVIGPRRSFDSGYQSLLTQGQREPCSNNANDDLTWLDQSLYEAIGASWGPMTAMNVSANF